MLYRNDYLQPPTYEETLSQQPTSSAFPTPPPSRPACDLESDTVVQEALQFARYAPPPNLNHRPLRTPIVIPQISPGLGQPFARAYCPDLLEFGVIEQDFVQCIDNFNVVSAGSPPLQVVDLAGGMVGMIPIHHAQIIATGIQAIAKIGKAVVSKTRGSMFISKVNEEFFNPRGLKLELFTSEALKVKLNMNSDEPFVVPMGLADISSISERRLASLGDRVAPVTFDVLPPNPRTNLLDKMCAAQQLKVVKKQDEKLQKERAKHAHDSDSADNEEEGSYISLQTRRDQDIAKINAAFDSKLGCKPKDARKIERDRSKELSKREKDHRKDVERLEKKCNRVEKQHKDRKRGSKEAKTMNKIQWMLVESLEGV